MRRGVRDRGAAATSRRPRLHPHPREGRRRVSPEAVPSLREVEGLAARRQPQHDALGLRPERRGHQHLPPRGRRAACGRCAVPAGARLPRRVRAREPSRCGRGLRGREAGRALARRATRGRPSGPTTAHGNERGPRPLVDGRAPHPEGRHDRLHRWAVLRPGAGTGSAPSARGAPEAARHRHRPRVSGDRSGRGREARGCRVGQHRQRPGYPAAA